MPSPGRRWGRGRRSQRLHRERDRLAAAETERHDPAPLATRAKRVQQRDEKARARRSDGMPERDSAAVHVELLVGDAELAANTLAAAEPLVHLEQVHRVDGPPRALEHAGDRAAGGEEKELWFARVLRLRDDTRQRP